MDYITLVNGIKTLVRAIVTSSGVADAGKIARTSSDGKFDPSLINDGFASFDSRLLTGDLTGGNAFDGTENFIQYIDAGGSNRDIELPDAVNFPGRQYRFINIGGNRVDVLLIESGIVAGTQRVRPNRSYYFHSDGSEWTSWRES